MLCRLVMPRNGSMIPFGGTLVDGKLYGRGAADMKGGIAAFVAAVSALDGADDTGSISFIITGDEEGDADFRHG
jgi:succinyl-diaminopimelate desuccinylase